MSYESGLETRRAVLGADYVDNAVANADDFTRPLQELVTTYCWGDVWGRPELDLKTRSLLNLAMLTALNKPTSFACTCEALSTTGSPRWRFARCSCKPPFIAACRPRWMPSAPPTMS